MKVYISVDIEGVSNVVMPYQFISGDRSGQRTGAIRQTQEMATREVNAAIEGAAAGGATEFIVNENHSGRDIIPEMLDKRAILLSGQGKFLATAHGIEGCDTLFLTGIHPMMGTKDGVGDHTWIPRVISEFRVNGKPIGETGLNAFVAGHYNIPTSLVTGDKAVCEEAIDLLGEVETVAVKEGVGRYAAYCPHPDLNMEKIRQAAEKAIRNLDRYTPLRMETPYKLEWDFANQQQANQACMIQGAKRVSPRTVSFEVPDFYEGMKLFCVVSTVSHSGTDPVMG